MKDIYEFLQKENPGLLERFLRQKACRDEEFSKPIEERYSYKLDIYFYIVQPLKDKCIIDAADIISRPKWGFDIYLYKNKCIINCSITYSMLQVEDLKEIEKILERQCLIYTQIGGKRP